MKALDLLPWDVAYEHPVPVFVFISRHIIRAVEKVHELALIHEVQHSLAVTFACKNSSTFQEQSFRFFVEKD